MIYLVSFYDTVEEGDNVLYLTTDPDKADREALNQSKKRPLHYIRIHSFELDKVYDNGFDTEEIAVFRNGEEEIREQEKGESE